MIMNMTVNDFINQLLSAHDSVCFSGRIGIANPNSLLKFGSPYIEYQNGNLLSTFPEDILNKKLTAMRSIQIPGCLCVDYILELED